MRWSQLGLVVGMLACSGTLKQKPMTESEAVRTEEEPATAVLTALAKAAEGRPVPGIEFRIRQALEDRPKEYRGTTDAQGQAVLTVPAGWYVFTADVPGYQSFVDPDVRIAREHPATVTMTLRPAATVSGRVVDGAGQPLGAVSLSWFPADTTAPRLDLVSNPDGGYRFEGMGPGPGVLLAQLQGYSDERRVFDARPEHLTLVMREQGALRVTAFAPDGRPVSSPEVRLDAPDPVTREGAWIDEHVKDAWVCRGLEARRYRVRFRHPLAGNAKWIVSSEVEVVAEQTRELALRFDGLVERAPLQGRVVGADGQPAADVWLQAFSGDPKKDAFASEDSTRTDAEGRFTFEHLTRGPVRVVVEKGDATLEFGPQAGDVSVELRSQPIVEGRVLGPDGKPLTRFIVNAMFYEGPEGRYQHSLYGPGPTGLVFAANGLSSTRRRVVPMGERTVLPDVILEEAAVRTVRGRLVREDGQPALSKGSVNLLPSPERESTFAGPRLFAKTEADGRFVLKDVPREPFILEADSEEDGTASQPLVPAEEEVTVRLVPAAILEGTVVDDAGRPLQGFGLTARCDDNPKRFFITDAEGRFRSHLPSGRECFLSVDDTYGPSGWPSPPQRVFWPYRFTVRPGETIHVDLRPRSGPASVEVLFPTSGKYDEVFLVPGDIPMPSTEAAMTALMGVALAPDCTPADQRPERHMETWYYYVARIWEEPRYSQLPLGRYTLFVVAGPSELVVLRYPVNLTEPGVHRFEMKRPVEGGVHFVR
ncbi:carboxypeptidase-like regulatory domain-containing protein [Corallococcus aberystwythensis]|uniref:Carboxypeptidase regulatory-like domain-containing protein n=1 Tax=Corallococcus aberystwythensis TaxID=2316722 RepID=A0A3A8Q5E8_9BACT|nr:carboxypeptidase-like regulatory domain-containing protein [Corallococcus aberystwythensis]RKH62731.1 carboxypeptidase regulatory-like domain-containing protein [Corallococcus aberystwythensis]